MQPASARRMRAFWIAVKELKLSCHDSDTLLGLIHPHSGNLN